MTGAVVESDEKPPERYRRLMMELVVARREAGGSLAVEEEARRVDELDRLWWAMSDAEQDAYEREMGRTIAKAWRKGRVVPLGPQPLPRVGWWFELYALPRWSFLLLGVVYVMSFWTLGRGCR